MKNRLTRSAVIGFAAAPLPPALILTIISPITTRLHWYDFFGWIVVFYLCALMLNLIVGIPAFLIFAPRGLIRWWSAFSIGAIGGFIAAVVLMRPANSASAYLLLYAALGALSGLTFWSTWKAGESLRKQKEVV